MSQDWKQNNHNFITVRRIKDSFVHSVKSRFFFLFIMRYIHTCILVYFRIDWLQQGSRELFGTVIEDQIYILVDTSASMNPHIEFVKDKLFTLMQVGIDTSEPLYQLLL